MPAGRIFFFFLTTWIFCHSWLMAEPAWAQQIMLQGKWASRLGVLRIRQKGNQVSGMLIWVSKTCPFRRGDEILRGTLLEDSLSGKWRYCLRGKDCNGDDWAPVVMLVARGGRVLSGAAYYPPTECRIGGKRRGSGVVIRKLRPKTISSTRHGMANRIKEPAKPTDDRGKPLEEEIKPLDPKDYHKNRLLWQEQMEMGKNFMERGFFERARKGFRQAIRLDPTLPEAYNGIGVTYYARGDYQEALNWYKQALEVNPDFGDAFYNMACIYALMKKNDLALRYLSIAVLNGYVEHEAMQQDADLDNLRSDPRYQQVLDTMRKKASR